MEITKIILSFIVAFTIGIIIAPLVIMFMRKQKAKQTILHYVEAHAGKQGTPTMGGVIFLFALSISCAIFLRENSELAVMSLIITFSYALLGFLDDFIKIKLKQNLGLRPYQKILFQIIVATLVAVYVYKSNLVGSEVEIPFGHLSVDFKYFIIPFTIVVFLACTNAVNLTDGLDGLATITTFIFLMIFIALLLIGNHTQRSFSVGNEKEIFSLIVFCSATCGGLLAFLWFNAYPAKIFMGDTGSMALGAIVACVAIFSRTTLFIPIIGAVFVASALSVCIQVAYYKKTKRRIFLMAPLHHHFEKKGIHETKIVTCYAIVTFVLGFVTLLFEFL